uniref:Mucin-5AC-like n=1 Tax=Scleropages formosus TaxID=113540 RepID=A0A8C9TJH1_SCLFO
MRRLALCALCALLGVVSGQGVTGTTGNDFSAVTSYMNETLTNTTTIHPNDTTHPNISAEPDSTVTPSTTPQSTSNHTENVTFTTVPSINESLATNEPNISSTTDPNDTTPTLPTTTLTSNSSSTTPYENVTFTTVSSINESLATNEPNISSTTHPNDTTPTLPTTTLTSNSSNSNSTTPHENVTFTTVSSINESLATNEPNISSTTDPNDTTPTLPTTTLTSNSNSTTPYENVTFTTVPSINESLATEGSNISSTTDPNDTTPTLPTTTLTSNSSNSSSTTPSPGGTRTTANAGNETLTTGSGANQTTPAPESNTSSTVHPNSTAEPNSNGTVTPTQPPPDANRTTVTTGNTTSVTAPALSETAATQSNASGTVRPNTTSQTEPHSTVISTTVPTGLCTPKSCPPGSFCVELYANFTCQCRPGTFFSGGSCVPVKVFPGALRLTALNFTSEMTNTASKVFAETSAMISQTLRNALRNQPGYLRSIVLQLTRGSVVATVENLFERSSAVTETILSDAITTAINTCENCELLKGANFTTKDPCSLNPSPCDLMTAQCSFSEDGIVSCTCNPEYVPDEFSSISCTACPSGEKAQDGKCVPCPFGYAGFNCNDSALLAVVVISCVLGGLLLIATIALLACCCCRTRQKNQGYSSPYAANEPVEPLPRRTVPKIPRATASSRWDPSEMEMRENGNARLTLAKEHPGNGAGFYDIGDDELKTFRNKNPSRYSYLVQGRENPYFVPDEGEK